MTWLFGILFLLGVPFLAVQAESRKHLPSWLSPVIICYGLGIMLASLKWPLFPESLSKHTTEVSILLALPLLLFATEIRRWLPVLRTSLFSFGLIVLSGIVMTAISAWLFRAYLSNSCELGGMIVGLYTGGTPNMQAIGMALKVPEAQIILVNAADIFTGAIYLLFLLSIGGRFFGLFLPPFQQKAASPGTNALANINAINGQEMLIAFLLAIGVVAASVGGTFLFFGNLEQTGFLLFLLTSLALACSAIPSIRRLRGSYWLGNYFLLVFCLALGLRTDFTALTEQGGMVLAFTASAMLSTLIAHTLLSRLFRLDRDTTIIVSVAALYGPVFVGQVAAALKNRELLFAGLVLGLLGFAIGNYLGLALSGVLCWLFS